MRFSFFVWLMACTALVLPFLDTIWRKARASWVERALTARLVLLLLELGAIVGWLLVRRDWDILPKDDVPMAVAGAILALTGGLLSAWARVRLGRLFSIHLGVQRQHRLIQDGPYAIVRHPIYLGIIDFILGSALVWNDAGLLLLAVTYVGLFTVQLRFEEDILARHFGPEYAAYRRRIPALLPRLRPGRRR